MRVTTLSLQVLATPVDLVLDASTEDAAAIDRAWARCSRASDVPSTTATRIELSSTPAVGAHASLASRLTRVGIEGLAGQQLLFHAAGLADDDGRVLVLVGPSGAGKSTATVELCREAFGYVTDETVAVDDSFAIVPFPKPLLIRKRPLPPKDVIGPDELGLRTCPPHVRASKLVLLRRDGTAEARLERLPLADALLALIPETSSLGRLHTPLQTLSRFVERCGGVSALHYSEIADAAHLLTALMDDEADDVDPWEAVAVDASSDPIPETVVAAPVDDAVRIGDEVVVLKDGRPFHLRGIGATLWTTAVAGATSAQMTAAVDRAHGRHPDGDRLVQTAVESMLEHGVLEQV